MAQEIWDIEITIGSFNGVLTKTIDLIEDLLYTREEVSLLTDEDAKYEIEDYVYEIFNNEETHINIV